MLPTFSGRYQTRIFLTLFVGVPVTVLYAIFVGGLPLSLPLLWTLLGVLLAIFIVGAILDPLYIVIQWTRWDRDWPFAYQFFFSIVEFGIVIGLASAGWIPWLNEFDFQQGAVIRVAIWHFAWVFSIGFLLLLGPLGVFFVRWRYKGGEFGKL
jgi:hypothetical protein